MPRCIREENSCYYNKNTIVSTKVASTREEKADWAFHIKFAVSTKKKIVRLIRKIKAIESSLPREQ